MIKLMFYAVEDGVSTGSVDTVGNSPAATCILAGTSGTTLLVIFPINF